MARPAPSTIVHAVFVDRTEYAQARREESERSLDALGITAVRRTYLGLPDGQLHGERYHTAMVTAVGMFVVRHGITAMLTMGEAGHCGHGDHKATHRAAVGAQQWTWSEFGWPLDIYALAAPDQPTDETIAGNQADKEHALGFHATQMARVTTAGGRHQLRPDFRKQLLPTYGQLFQQERYIHIPAPTRDITRELAASL
jgi:LmbE family N-acetylglucosaminyl deacetylase